MFVRLTLDTGCTSIRIPIIYIAMSHAAPSMCISGRMYGRSSTLRTSAIMPMHTRPTASARASSTHALRCTLPRLPRPISRPMSTAAAPPAANDAGVIMRCRFPAMV